MKASRKAIYSTFILQFLFIAFLIARSIDASSGVVTSLYGGVGGSIPYQSAANTTAFLANGSAGQVLTSAGTTLAPVWAASSGGIAGSGTAGLCPRWAAGSPSTTLEDSRVVCTNTLFQANISSGLGGRVLMGDLTPLNNSVVLDVNDSSDTILLQTNPAVGITSGAININSGHGSTVIGDTTPVVNGTKLSVIDNTQTIGLGGNNITLSRTVTPAGTTGAQTINKAAGTINFPATTTATIVVTDSFVSATSQVFITVQNLDATCRTFGVNAKGAGSFQIWTTAVCTAETSVAFWVTN